MMGHAVFHLPCAHSPWGPTDAPVGPQILDMGLQHCDWLAKEEKNTT